MQIRKARENHALKIERQSSCTLSDKLTMEPRLVLLKESKRTLPNSTLWTP
ncbi:hypothetical protein X975_01848, partial [Stegodyphus mimosarum]